VIEEYMRQGQSFARTLWSPKTAQEAFSTDPQQLAGRMYQYASDFAGAWLEYVQAMMAQVPSAPITQPGTPLGGFGLSTNGTPATRSTGQQAPGPQAPVTQPPTQRTGPLSDTASQVAISVQISSKRRTEVTVDLRPGSLTGALSVLDLRATDGAAGRISSVTAEVSDAGHRVTFRIDVADDQPPGVYMGVVVDDGANLPRGALSVRVFG
jgi:hypothetical protein